VSGASSEPSRAERPRGQLTDDTHRSGLVAPPGHRLGPEPCSPGVVYVSRQLSMVLTPCSWVAKSGELVHELRSPINLAFELPPAAWERVRPIP